MTHVGRRILSLIAATLVTTAALANGAAAAGGDLDTTFSVDGKAFTDFTSKIDYAEAVAVQGDGKILAVGASASGSKFAVARYEPDGTLDPTFGTDGKVTTKFTRFGASATAVVIQPDGKIVVAGGAWPDRFALARYNVDGTLDLSFGGDGKVMSALGVGGWATAEAVAVEPDGKIVAAGRASEFGTFAVLRYLSNGLLDATFGGDGKVTTRMGRGEESATALALQADGKIVVAGYTDFPHEFGDTFGPGASSRSRAITGTGDSIGASAVTAR